MKILKKLTDFLFILRGKGCVSLLLLCCTLSAAGCASDRAVTFENVGTALTEAQDSQTDGEESREVYDSPEICVYVCGEVNYPGVYSLPPDSRVNDALNAAGGFTQEADRSYVNLAARVSDGDRLYFPGVAEAAQEKAAEEALKAGLVNINTADEELLCTLPGIGSSRAQDIISYREDNGAFESKEDIMKVSGIKESAYSKICDKITVGNE